MMITEACLKSQSMLKTKFQLLSITSMQDSLPLKQVLILSKLVRI